jgi:ubiquinone/menaquinone biosynthesis C-methylase UbiE
VNSNNIDDRQQWLSKLKDGTISVPVVLDVGCGSNKLTSSAIGIDICGSPEVDIVGDVFDVLSEIPDSSVDLLYSSHFFEHINDIPRLLTECVRIVKPKGLINITVPHFSNPFFYSDPTHIRFFGLYTFMYYAECGFMRRAVPSYSRILGLSISNIELIFKSYRPRYIRHIFKRAVQYVINLSSFNKELYEEFFTYLIPCYEVQVFMTVNK